MQIGTKVRIINGDSKVREWEIIKILDRPDFQYLVLLEVWNYFSLWHCNSQQLELYGDNITT